MRVGIVGGTEKNLTRFAEVAAEEGCEVEFHDGRLAGRGSEALETLLSRCDVIVLITRINSHAAVQKTQKFCRRYPRKVLFMRRFGLHALQSVAREYQSSVAHRPTEQVSQSPRKSFMRSSGFSY